MEDMRYCFDYTVMCNFALLLFRFLVLEYKVQ